MTTKRLGWMAGTLSVAGLVAAPAQIASRPFVPPKVFQAAGPTAASIQSTVDAFRAELGDNNFSVGGPLAAGRREINWDGGGGGNNPATVVAPNPFRGFQLTRGAIFTTPDGTGFVQGPPAADPILAPPGGLAGLFDNPSYATTFGAFSPLRLFGAIGSNVIETTFVVPVANVPASVSAFGAVFTDVDQPDGSGPGGKRGNRGSSTLLECFGARGDLLFSGFVPAAPGDGSFSFLGVAFDEPRIVAVRITAGDVAPGPDDGSLAVAAPRPAIPFAVPVGRGSGRLVVDVVMTDDFIYGEPQRLP
jgi:hypothetical protein